MEMLITLFQLAVIWLVTYVVGLAAVKTLLPRDIELEYGALITPTVGYLLLCFVSFTVSGATGISARAGVIVVMIALAVAALALQLRPEWRLSPRSLARQWAQAGVLVLPMAVVTLGPLFRFGAQTYLGAVNPDYFAGILDNYYMLEGNHSTTTFSGTGKDDWYPIPHIAGHLTVSARFGADLFGLAIQQLLGVDTRTALTLAIGFFLLNLPLTLYFFCRVAMNFPAGAARWSAWLIGVSGPIGLSFLYFYIGQNSGLPAVPLLLVAVYLMLLRPGWRTLLFCALLSNALFINYFAMLPYALAPGGLLALYLVYKRRLSLLKVVGLGIAFLVIGVLLKAGTWQHTLISLQAWGTVIGQTLQGQFFLDFLTESFFPYFFGVYNYPANAWLVRAVGDAGARTIGVVIAFGLVAVWVACVRTWFRGNRDDASRVFVLAAMAVYAIVWWRYTFVRQYGYAVFKMASWLQFMLVPFFAYGIHWLLESRAVRAAGGDGAPRLRTRIALWAGCAVYVTLNVVASAIYAYNGGGTNTRSGYIVNHFGTAGNHDYFEIASAVGKHMKPEQSVGLIFTDSIRHYWTSYYLREFRQSILAHEIMPGDDENLPDPETNVLVDYYGTARVWNNSFFHGGVADDFYLTWGNKDLNVDIAEPLFKGVPLWENGSFRLYPKSAARDIIFTGRGFYRIEYFPPIADYFFPRVLRWSADGGEFYLLRPSVPGGRYRLAFDAIVGYEYPSETRTLEIWRNGRKFQDLTITSSARVVSEPFEADPGVTKLVVTVKERNKSLPRRLGIWNRDIPADYRRLNVAFANVRALAPDAAPMPEPPLGKQIPFLQWHPLALRFNGMETAGWMADRAEVTMSVPKGASRVALHGLASGTLNLLYPLELKFSVNGRQVRRVLPSPGVFVVDAPIAPGETEVALTLESPQSTDIGERRLRSKLIKRSLRLDSLEFS